MDISYKSNKVDKTLNKYKELVKAYGDKQAKKIKIRMSEFRAAVSLEDIFSLPQARCHPLSGQQEGQLSVDIIYPLRIVFIPDHNPIPLLEDGGLDKSNITAIKILGVEDTHDHKIKR